MARRKKTSLETHAWPGYVDALSTLLMVVTFVLLVFVIGQVLLSIVVTNKERNLRTLTNDRQTLLQQVLEAQKKSLALSQQIEQQSQALFSDTHQIEALKEQNQSLTQQLTAIHSTFEATQAQLSTLQASQAQAQATLTATHRELEQSTTTIASLTKKLNATMAAQNSPLLGIRNEFYAHLKEQLKNQSGLGVIDDRFIFQSEILFPPGTAELSPEGQKVIATLAHTLTETAKHIPPTIPWILRVDGHADRQPIHSTYPSNWELSTARAITVVKLLIQNGVNPAHLAATGFAEFQPIHQESTPDAFAKNRRIEFRLTSR
ncbi:OmpA family protein [Entomobacter blattae]|uniref:OmpA family protein n=1 Tax=Entomobacter blattae TaxID=2762277 RepID=A0A7H1NTC4_9PROT|nr:OmpA family protein [Entomobacter blattae]QNT79034.1 OmpA family protein [Entomobacter blattae]